jgi:nucleotidyltransferase substrate binding protein (TIGR01987 family)
MRMKNKDIRWIQRFYNFNKAVDRIKRFIEKGELNEFEEQGLIKAFEYTYELSWKAIKDFYEHQGETTLQGARDAFRIAFNRGLISEGKLWMQMIDDRNQTSHTYNEEIAQKIIKNIEEQYYQLFIKLQNEFNKIEQNENNE